ncbi:MAG: hypothetical protein ACTSRK_15320 [Promethearchaeota archaeon]
MSQINFRVDLDTKSIIDLISERDGISSAELAKRSLMDRISKDRVEIAFELLNLGKIGRKKCLTISGLTIFEFLKEWTKRGAEEQISENIIDKEIEALSHLNLKNYLKKG